MVYIRNDQDLIVLQKFYIVPEFHSRHDYYRQIQFACDQKFFQFHTVGFYDIHFYLGIFFIKAL